MNTLPRRQFLKTTALATAGLVAARSARAAGARMEILLDEPIGTISPNLHGHFTEHIGGVVYDGIWVGEGSKVPNIGGVRAALVGQIREANAALQLRLLAEVVGLMLIALLLLVFGAILVRLTSIGLF